MIKIEYDEQQLLKDLQALEQGLQGKLIRKALTPAVKPIRDAMKALVPEDSGSLKSALGVVKLSDRAKGRLGIDVTTVAILLGAVRKTRHELDGKTVRRGQGYKAIWNEYGTKGKTSRPAKPFMGPALDRGSSEMQTRFFQGLQKAINRL